MVGVGAWVGFPELDAFFLVGGPEPGIDGGEPAVCDMRGASGRGSRAPAEKNRGRGVWPRSDVTRAALPFERFSRPG